MSEKVFEKYRGESLEQLIQLQGKYRHDTLLAAVEGALSTKSEASLSEPEIVILAVSALEREVNNGGFNQFFFNSSGRFAPRIIQDLKDIGCPKFAKIAERAVAILGPINLADHDALQEACVDDSKEAAFNKVDNQFYKYPEDLSGRLWAYVTENASSIRLPVVAKKSFWQKLFGK